MRKLLNTLYVTSENSYLSLEGGNVVVDRKEEGTARFPLHILEGIVTFGYAGASPALMGACADQNISLVFLTANGRFLGRVVGAEQGNVLLRRQQYRIADDNVSSCLVAKNMVAGKIYNSRWCLERALRDHILRIDGGKVETASGMLKEILPQTQTAQTIDSLRGIEGSAASIYFSCIDELILQQKADFFFKKRSRRPPMDNFNAMLSFVYMLLAAECAACLNAAGLDPYVGFLHRDRPGRKSLALDLMEELRPVLGDRFVITLINKKIVAASGFITLENGAVQMDEKTRKTILTAWQERKREMITHPFLKEKIPWGLVPHAQAMLLARHIRGDLDAYPPFFWK